MTTLPIEDEKDLRLIAEMEFANDTSPEEKAALGKWTKLFQEVRGVRIEIERCKGMKVDKEPEAAALARHIKGEEERADKIDAEMKPLWAEYEVLRDKMEPVRKEKAERVRKLLVDHGFHVAQDIIDNGCTGLFLWLIPPERGVPGISGTDFEEGKSEAIKNARFVRENMGGARVSLPCYVGPDRYCLIHQTIGGLQIGQKPNHTDQVPYISRDLTPEEKGHATLVESVRRREGTMRDGRGILTGQKIPEDLKIESLSPQDAAFKRQMDAAGVPPRSEFVPLPSFVCPEHGAISWGCRFCLAQALANGSLATEIFLQPTIATIEGPATASLEPMGSATDVVSRLEALDAAGAHGVKVYAKVASFRRRLAMD